jgi:8-oxo-dGTP pyrophosphatase MutT (NUDIX family)
MDSIPTVTALNGRTFACAPAAILVFIVNEREELLLLSSPTGKGYEVVNGGVEAHETVLAAALRETREEAGPLVLVRPLGTVHTCTHHYDAEVDLISVAYLMAYEGGEVTPGDDMAGSEARWGSREEIESGRLQVYVPAQRWMCRRAFDLYRLWKDEPALELEIAVPQRS